MIYDSNNLFKSAITVIIIFIIIKFLVETRIVEAILLALIIAISVYVVENIIQLTYIDPNSELCKKCITESNIENTEIKEKFKNIEQENSHIKAISNTPAENSNKESDNIKQVVGVPEFSDGYVKYQQDGEQEQANKELEKQNLFRMEIGNPAITKPLLKMALNFMIIFILILILIHQLLNKLWKAI